MDIKQTKNPRRSLLGIASKIQKAEEITWKLRCKKTNITNCDSGCNLRNFGRDNATICS